MKTEFTKAGMLQYIKENLPEVNILPMYILDTKRYFADAQGELTNIVSYFQGLGTELLAVRSSSRQEDTSSYSNAGKYRSLLNIPLHTEKLGKALEEVFESYGTEEQEEILIQPMMTDVARSGVVFTADMETMACYYTINYFEGYNTEAVTAGTTNDLKTYIVYHSHIAEVADKGLQKLLYTCQNIEAFLKNLALDIEFAITSENKVFVFQVRPIARGIKKQYMPLDLNDSLKRISKKVEKLSRPHPFLLGETTYFGVMPDWNPAEILGVRPRKLAISLYKELITDNIWAHQRANYGYRNLTMHPLMVSLGGIPYIDTRISFNSFIPDSLNERIAEKLVNYYLQQLKEYPVYHDKIEFEIVYSCYYLGIEKKLEKLQSYGFSENECKRIEFSLLNITNRIISPKDGLYKKDLEKAAFLEEKFNVILDSEISLVDKIYWLIEVCKEFGTLPFAGVARAGFIAIQMLNSMVNVGILTEEEKGVYMNSLHTVNRELSESLEKLRRRELSEEAFLEKYGHIRPGTYDIMSPRYDETFEQYFDMDANHQSVGNTVKSEEYTFSEQSMKALSIMLVESGLEITANELLQFIKEAIEGREHVKYIFTKSVSKVLQLIEELGQRVGINKEDLAHLDIAVIKNLYTDLYMGNVKDVFRENIQSNKAQYEYAQRIKLPSLILEPGNVYQYYLLREEPNFVTQKEVNAEITADLKEGSLEGRIVFIQSADPGYDYLFSKGIAGLVTEFGGANSHMAIRCAELGIPAVIGAGESKYFSWMQAGRLQINCEKKQVICL